MTETPLERTAFGRTLVALMEERGVPVTWEHISSLAEQAAITMPDLLARMRDADADYPGNLSGLADALGLDHEERMRLAWALSYERE